jgi:hypothetical protein
MAINAGYLGLRQPPQESKGKRALGIATGKLGDKFLKPSHADDYILGIIPAPTGPIIIGNDRIYVITGTKAELRGLIHGRGAQTFQIDENEQFVAVGVPTYGPQDPFAPPPLVSRMLAKQRSLKNLRDLARHMVLACECVEEKESLIKEGYRAAVSLGDMGAGGALDSAVGGLLAVAEKAPDLNKNFQIKIYPVLQGDPSIAGHSTVRAFPPGPQTLSVILTAALG